MKFVAWMAHHLETCEIVDDYIARVKPLLADHDFVICEDLDTIKREIVDADVFIGWRITPEVFAEARKLKWIQFGSAGIDHTLFPELLRSQVILTTVSGIHAAVVSEHVLAQMLALARRLDLAIRQQIAHIYNRCPIASTADELAGKTVGIVGLGKIGQNIARLAMALGMGVVATKRVPEPDLMADEVFAPADFHRMLPKCDFLVLVLPLTSETKALIGREEVALLKDGAFLINVARGAMIDHAALGEALRSGKLAGAALDVFPEEPLPSDSPIWDFPNVIITPHTGGSHRAYGRRAAAIFEQNLKAFIAGEPMVNVFDRKRGY